MEEELEIILVPHYSKLYNVLSYPLNNTSEFNKHYQLISTKYGLLSNNMTLQYRQRVETEQIPNEVSFDVTSIPNRTFMCACKRIGNKLYVFPIRNFSRVRPIIRAKTAPPTQIHTEKTKADELIYQRNKAKYLEIMKKSWAWQSGLRNQEEKIELTPEESKLEAPEIKTKNILSLKQISKRKYQEELFKTLV